MGGLVPHKQSSLGEMISLIFFSFFFLASDAVVYQTTIPVVTPARTFQCIYKIAYDADPLAIHQADSRVTCNPNKKGGPTTTTEVYIPDIVRTVNVTHRIKRGADTIQTMELQPLPPTEAPPSEGSMSLSCQCRLPLSFPDGSFASSRMLVRDGRGNSGVSNSSGLSSLLPLIASFVISFFLGQSLAGLLGVNPVLGRSLNQEESVSERQLEVVRALQKVTSRQLLGNLFGGNTGSTDLSSLLTGGLTGGSSNDVMNTLVQQMVEQQINDFINNGGAEDAINNLVSSGQLETMITNLIASGAIENSPTQMMESGALQEALSGAMEEAVASMVTAGNDNMPTIPPAILESLGAGDGGLTDFMEQLNQMSMPEFNSEEFMNNLNMNEMELNMPCDCAPRA